MDLLWTIPVLMLAFIPFVILCAVVVLTVIGLILVVNDKRQANRANQHRGIHRQSEGR